MRQLQVLFQPLRMSLSPKTDRLRPLGAGNHCQDGDHNQVAEQMFTIDRAAWVFEVLEVIKNRNNVVGSDSRHALLSVFEDWLVRIGKRYL